MNVPKNKAGLKLERQLVLEGHLSSVYTLADLTGSRDFISGGGDGWLVRWNKYGEENHGRLIAQVEGKVFSSAYIADKQWLLAGDMAGHLYWIDLVENAVMKRQILHKGSVFSIKVIGEYIYTCGADGVLCRSQIEKMLPDTSLQLSRQGLRCLEKVENTLWVGGSDGGIRILDIDTLEVVNEIPKAHQNTVFSLYYNGKEQVFSGGRDAMLTLWDTSKLRLRLSVPAHWYTVNAITGIGENVLLTGSRDKAVRLWSQEDLTLLYAADVFKEGHIRSVNCALYLPESGLVATAGDDRTIILWKLSEQ